MKGTKTYQVRTISDFHKVRGLASPGHPLISVVDYATIVSPSATDSTNWIFDFYSISIKRGINGKIKYGQQDYDFDEGVMFFMAPGQTLRIEPDMKSSEGRSGWLLLIHPDFLWNTPLAKTIRKYGFFDYAVNEALFLSEKEETTVESIIQSIIEEYHSKIDQFSQRIIISQIETLLNYSERFYQRQFITRKIASHQMLTRLEQLLEAFFNKESSPEGLPTVQHVADALSLSPGYLSSLLKELTGLSTQQHIHEKLIEKAREKLSTTGLSVSEIAYALGFEHPQSFSKLFKSKTGQSPVGFRESFN